MGDTLDEIKEVVTFIKSSSRFDIVFLYTDETVQKERLKELINLDIPVIKWNNKKIEIDLDKIESEQKLNLSQFLKLQVMKLVLLDQKNLCIQIIPLLSRQKR